MKVAKTTLLSLVAIVVSILLLCISAFAWFSNVLKSDINAFENSVTDKSIQVEIKIDGNVVSSGSSMEYDDVLPGFYTHISLKVTNMLDDPNKFIVAYPIISNPHGKFTYSGLDEFGDPVDGLVGDMCKVFAYKSSTSSSEDYVFFSSWVDSGVTEIPLLEYETYLWEYGDSETIDFYIYFANRTADKVSNLNIYQGHTFTIDKIEVHYEIYE